MQSVRGGSIVARSAVAAVADGQVLADLVVLEAAVVEAAGALVFRRTLQVVPGSGRRVAEDMGGGPAWPAVHTRGPREHTRVGLDDPQRKGLARALDFGHPAASHVHVVWSAHAVRLPVVVALHTHAHTCGTNTIHYVIRLVSRKLNYSDVQTIIS